MTPATASIAVPGHPSELRRLHAFLGEFWTAHRLPPGDAMRVEVGLEEVFINAVTHGRSAAGIPAGAEVGPVTVDLRLDDGRLELAVEDAGPPFDPLTVGPPDMASPLESRAVGGLGIHLVRHLLDDVRYERRGDRNRLVMTARLAGPVGPDPGRDR